jgi:3-hydroxyacyl-CoA dehydrogenase
MQVIFMESEISIVAIVGSGKMGMNLFYYLLDFDFRLILVCETIQQKEGVLKTFLKKLNREVKNQLISEEAFRKKLSKATIADSLESVKESDLLIEAITEDKELKQQLFAKIKTIVKTECILTSNSSSILAYQLGFGNNIIGLHFFYPVFLKNIVELMVSEQTDPNIIRKIEQFLRKIDRNYLILNTENAFMLNRIFLDFQNKAYLLMVKNNLGYKEIDTLVKKYFFPIGVFEFFDSVGLDVMLTSVKNYSSFSKFPEQYSGLMAELNLLVSQGRLGQKSGNGFYTEETSNSLVKPIDPMVEEQIYLQMNDCYVQTSAKFAKKGFYDSSIINEAVKEYMGIEKGPFEKE